MPFLNHTVESHSFLSNIFSPNEQPVETLLTEKQNLLSVFKLVMKDLLNSSLRHERLVEKEYFPLKHFFVVLEHILLHGYQGKKSFVTTSSNRKDLWPLIELIVRKSNETDICDIFLSSKEMTNVKTQMGRVRAWLRLALMQKRLADYFRLLIEQKQLLNEYYDSQALLVSDEINIVSGLLVGLNVIDFNFIAKDTNLDYPLQTTINYSLYLRERRIPSKNFNNHSEVDELDDYSSISSSSLSSNSPTSTTITSNNNDLIENNNSDATSTINNDYITFENKLTSVLDQKNYLEELNRNLQRATNNLQDRFSLLEQTYNSLKNDFNVQKIRIDTLEEDNAKLKLEKEQMQQSFQTKIDALHSDIAVERDTYQKSRSGLDEMYSELQKKYDEECQTKQEMIKEFELQMSMKTDYENATKMMEKDLEVKTTLFNHMKEQINDVKNENIKYYEKLQTEISRSDEKEHQVQCLEKENKMLRETISQLESNIGQINKEKHALGDTNTHISQLVSKADSEKSKLETDLHVEKEFRQRLQQTLTTEKEKVSKLQFEIHELNLIKHEYDTYKKDMSKQHEELKKNYAEQEETIKELAFKLEISIKREDEFREKDGYRSSTWVKDEDVKECNQCRKDFNPLSRRKHHCRQCGNVFCEACASTRLSLPSSNKPVRVCDACRNHLLQQCAVNHS
ncbi:unnamed protein product [Didymodactylos carnosus]|nr:unnamed protein product [Didymodactylos carnosus]CAF4106286.1 unnamed protein product [Didymodactylos carnosus]